MIFKKVWEVCPYLGRARVLTAISIRMRQSERFMAAKLPQGCRFCNRILVRPFPSVPQFFVKSRW